MTRFVASSKPSPQVSVIKKGGASNYINLTYPGLITAPGGSQASSSWYVSCANDLRRIWASIQGYYINQNSTTKSEFAGNAGSIPNATFRYVLESAMSVLHLANTCGTPVNMELYDIVCKRDTPQVPLAFTGNFLSTVFTNPVGRDGQGTTILDPSIAWYLGMTNQASQATGFETNAQELPIGPSNLGATPYQSKLFKDYFKVVRKSNVVLPIGGQHKHFVDLKPNFIIDNDLMSQNNTFKGLSFFTLVVVNGVPVIACPRVDASGNPIDPLGDKYGDASTSAVSVSVIQNIKYKWSWVEDARENIYRANYINTKNSNFQSVQPAMTKLSSAENNLEVTKEGTFVNLPSECTR